MDISADNKPTGFDFDDLLAEDASDAVDEIRNAEPDLDEIGGNGGNFLPAEPSPTQKRARAKAAERLKDQPGRLVHGLKGRDGMKLPEDAIEEMQKKREFYEAQIRKLEAEKTMGPMEAMMLMVQAERVARTTALLASMYERMLTDTTYRKRMQDPQAAATVLASERSVQTFEARLFQLMGVDAEHNAKLSALEGKGKPTQINVTLGADLDKSHMAVQPGLDALVPGGEDG